ncbi:MAG: hypothetical protein DHS20C05_05970 [Hyphococcus sp.]|nr:MAG: hypothetical protein DHS20C05_05970 [Marinicaulis sp.]
MINLSHILGATTLLIVAACSQDQNSDAQGSSDFAPDISPDGRTVAFYSYREKRPDLYLLDVATGKETQLTQTPDFWEIEPSWSPDGTTLLYGGGATMQVLRQRIKTIESGADTVFGAIDKNLGPADWMSGGDAVVFIAKNGLFTQEGLSLINKNGEITTVDAELPPGENTSPHVSPDGRYIAFQNKHNGKAGILIFEIETKSIWRLADFDVENLYIAWSGNGDWITYSVPDGDRAPKIFGIQIQPESRTGNEPVRLTKGPDDQTQIFSSVSPDGAWLYYDGSTDAGFRIFRQSLTDLSSAPEQLTGQK